MTGLALPDVGALLDRMAADVAELLPDPHSAPPPAILGIHTGGVWVAEGLNARLPAALPFGSLDIAFYRDDFSRIGIHPRVRPSDLPFDLDDRVVLLVDDVLFTGRTVRAALNEIFDYGRPAAVRLAVLVDRGGRELPVAADVVGTTIALGTGEQVKLHGPEPLRLAIGGRE